MSKKEEKKVEEKKVEEKKAEPAAVSTNGNGNGGSPPTAMVLVKAGITVPTAATIQEHEAAMQAKLQVIAEMLTDTSLAAGTRSKLEQLFATANPVKPGMEEINRNWEVPRLNICQPTTRRAEKPDAAKAGDLYASTGAIIEKPFPFIPLMFFDEHVNFPQGSKAPDCKAPDAKFGSPRNILCVQCPDLPFGKQNGGNGDQKKTDCFSQYVVIALTADLQSLYAIPFAKTSRTAGNALVRMAYAQPYPWKQSYLLDTEKKTGEQGLYFIAKISAVGKDNGDEAQKIAKAFSELYSASRKKALAEFYLRASMSSAQAFQAEQQFKDGMMDLGDGGEGGEEPNVMPESGGSSVRSGKPM